MDTAKTYKVEIVSINRIDPLPKYKEFDLRLKVYADSQIINNDYNTRLGLLYDLNKDDPSKTVFVSIDSDTGEPLTDSFEKLILPRSEREISPLLSYDKLNFDNLLGAKGNLTSSRIPDSFTSSDPDNCPIAPIC